MLLTGDQILLKRLNRSALLWLLRTQPGLARVDLSRVARLTKATVGTLIDELIREGWLKEGQSVASRAGRPSTPLYLNEARLCALGVWLHPAGVWAVAVDLLGEVVAAQTLERPLSPLEAGIPAVQARQAVEDTLTPLLERLRGLERELLGMGVVFSECVAPRGSLGALGALKLEGLEGLPLAIGQETPAWALAESLFGAQGQSLALLRLDHTSDLGLVLGDPPQPLEHPGALSALISGEDLETLHRALDHDPRQALPAPALEGVQTSMAELLERLELLMHPRHIRLAGARSEAVLHALLERHPRLSPSRYGPEAPAVGAAALLIEGQSRPLQAPLLHTLGYPLKRVISSP